MKDAEGTGDATLTTVMMMGLTKDHAMTEAATATEKEAETAKEEDNRPGRT